MKIYILIFFLATLGGYAFRIYIVSPVASFDDYVLVEFAARLEEEQESFTKLSHPK